VFLQKTEKTEKMEKTETKKEKDFILKLSCHHFEKNLVKMGVMRYITSVGDVKMVN
jgi:hypothetical protein